MGDDDLNDFNQSAWEAERRRKMESVYKWYGISFYIISTMLVLLMTYNLFWQHNILAAFACQFCPLVSMVLSRWYALKQKAKRDAAEVMKELIKNCPPNNNNIDNNNLIQFGYGYPPADTKAKVWIQIK